MINRTTFLALALALAACKPKTPSGPGSIVEVPPKGAPPTPTSSTPGHPVRASARLIIASACPDVTSCGAVHDGTTNDTNAIRTCEANCAAAAASSGTQMCLPFPDGTYVVSEHGTSLRAIDVQTDVVLGCPPDVFPGQTRAGAIIKLANGQRDSVRPIYVSSSYAGVANLTIDGNKQGQTTDDEHRAGIFVYSGSTPTTGVTVQGVTSHDNTGDAIYIGNPLTTNVLIDDFDGHDNDRDAVAIHEGSFITTSNCQLSNSKIQNYDTEPSVPLHDIVLTGCTITAGPANGGTYVVTISGGGIDASKHSYNFDVGGNTINGPVFIVYVDNGSFHDNTVVQVMTTQNFPPVSMQGGSTNFTIANNSITLPAGSVNKTGITVTGNASVGSPAGLQITGNTIDVSAMLNPVGVQLISLHDATVSTNTIKGNPASTINNCVSSRSAAQGVPMTSLVVDGNTCSNFPLGLIAFSGVSPVVPIQYVEVVGDTFTDSTSRASNTAAALNYASAGVYENAVQSSTVESNTLTGVPNLVKPWPSTPVLVAGTRGAGGGWRCTGSPNGQIVEALSATAIQVDAPSQTWTKTADPGLATGWTQP